MSTNKKPDQMNKCEIKSAIEAIKSIMKRKKFGLHEMFYAVSIMVEGAVIDTILSMRREGKSIRDIARSVHMDDKRVSRIIKANKPAVPAKPVRPTGHCHCCKHKKA